MASTGLAAAAVTDPFPAHAAEAPISPLKVVLVGDSYSAGNGARDAAGDRDYYGPRGCYRSKSNWAEKYVSYLRGEGHQVTFVNRACSGAVTANMVTARAMGRQGGYLPASAGKPSPSDALAHLEATNPCEAASPYRDEEDFGNYELGSSDGVGGWGYTCDRSLIPQTDAINADTDLVLFTMGGNDIGFEGIIKGCFASVARSAKACKRAVDNARALLPNAMDGVENAVNQMRSNGLRDDARVVLAGYPLLALDNGYDLNDWFGLGAHYEAATEVRALGAEGNRLQSDLVDRLNSTNPGQVTHLGAVADHFAGHEPDGRASARNEDRWIHEFETRIHMEWYHPNPRGHEEYANLLAAGGTYGADGGAAERTGDIDIVFAIDTTGSMGGDIAAVRQYAATLADDIAARTSSARYALVTYRDHPSHTGWSGDYPARVDQPFTTDVAQFRAKLDTVTVGGGGDWPESMYSGIQAGLKLPWRPGVKKVVIVLADAPPHDPEPVTGFTATDVIRDAIAVDPAEVYVVDTASAVDSSLARVVAETGGMVVDAATSSDVPAALAAAFDVALTKPYAWINGPYVAKVGKTITLDGSGSYPTEGAIATYEWDFTSDGSYDLTTTEPVITHAWSTPYSGLLTLRVTDTAGRTHVANTHVGITDDGDETPRDVDNCPDIDNHGQEDADDDGIGDLCDDTPGSPWEASDVEGVTEGSDAQWPFDGFRAPVDNQPTVNSIKAGQAVPMKFSLGSDRGLDVVADGYPQVQRVSCNGLGERVDPIEDPLPATTRSHLSYDSANGQYKYVWKTPAAAEGTCQRFTIRLTDRSEHFALFRLK